MLQITPLKATIAGLWLVAVVVLGTFMPVDTTASWITIAAFGLMPAIFMLRAWRQPSQTISESIQEEFRK